LAKAVCELAIETRGWPIALCVAESAWPAIEASLSDRELALLRQGLFHVEAPHVVMPPEFGPAGLGVTETLHARVRNLRELGVAAARLAALATWASRGAMPSAPEQFLAEVLDDRVETTGLFELHGKLPVQFGTKPMEVDLLCRRPRIAIELDGWFHFTDRDHYRRDRRKDILLHEHGYVVLRFLAEDVVSHLEEVLSVITRSLTRARGQA
jgi:very-short-patch-repair endonuclease